MLFSVVSLSACNVAFPLRERQAPSGDATTGDATADARPPLPGLVAHYPLDELTSQQTLDISGTHHAICTIDSCPVPISDGRHDGAFRFDGQQFLRVLDQGTAFELPAFTIALWFRAEAGSTSPLRAMVALPLTSPADTSNPWALYTFQGSTEFHTAHLDKNPHVVEGPPYSANEWHHLAATWDGATKRLLFDGTGVNFEQVSSPYIDGPTSAAAIGADINAGAPAAQFVGDLDDIQLYDRALGDDELILLAR